MAGATSAKALLREFWQRERCGDRYLVGLSDAEKFDAQARRRYELEPHIASFADFPSARGKRVLEIGVGLGADFVEWCKAGAIATGVDLTSAAVETTKYRCALLGLTADLRVADAESLPFASNEFDIVYANGVLHHSPDPRRCFSEAWRVLKPGGVGKFMIYTRPSWVGFMLWVRWSLVRGRPWSRNHYDFMEYGTKCYTEEQARQLLAQFTDVHMRRVLSPGDLLTNDLSSRYQSRLYHAIQRVYPRRLIRRTGNKLGLFLLIEARKRKSGQ